MRGAWAIKRIGGPLVVAAALAGTAASPAAAMIGPACNTRLAAAAVGTSASCSFDAPYEYANIAVNPVVGSVTATIRCFTSWGTTYTTSRSVSSNTTWRAYTPGSCSLTLTAQSSLTTASGTSTPTIGPIVDPPPDPA